ncbi:MAG: helix-turn-helix transcriptional regulator [Clostridia bacterium]
MDFTKTFNILLETEKVKQVDLANYLHISKQAISNLKSGTSLPSLDILCGISKYFDVSTDYLLGLETKQE